MECNNPKLAYKICISHIYIYIYIFFSLYITQFQNKKNLNQTLKF